jgi:acetylornithine/N-succinyldiaminopimelate aminotransferase
MTHRQLFLQHVAQTSTSPLALEIERAEGCYLYDSQQKKYLDGIGGISVCNLGHGHPDILSAIENQAKKYLHVMVYGETIQHPQVRYAHALAQHLPPSLQAIYFTNSGSEATEGAMKLAKRVTGRSKIISFYNSYHGSTQGALSVMGSEYWQQAFRPLLPDIYQFHYGSEECLQAIDDRTACIILEPVQSEAGAIVPNPAWIQQIRERCDQTGCLLILDEIQTAFGRTGSLFHFNQLPIIPDVLLLGKALGGGMPMGAFVSSKERMDTLTENPVLGHITTFGGHPVCCAAGNAALQALLSSNYMQEVKHKEALFHSLLVHPAIQKIQSCGLLMAVFFENYDINKKIIDTCIENGFFTDWFLFASNALRIAPPLIISEEEIREACRIILLSTDQVYATR